jgi:nicotinate-nucleotide adenylyltransferase
MKLGVLGGTFDPVHRGHIAIAGEVRKRLALDSVLFVPAGQPWMKSEGFITLAEHRVAMVRLAVARKRHFELSTMEMERAGPTYTVDTLVELRKQLGEGDEIFFILGWGGLEGLPQWREPDRIIRLCQLVIVPRPGYSAPDVKALEAKIPGLTRRVIVLDGPVIDISATDIRERVAGGLSISHLVPDKVAEYIKEHGLYQKREEP